MPNIFDKFNRTNDRQSALRLISAGWKVIEVDHQNALFRLCRTGEMENPIETPWLRWPAMDGEWDPPKVGQLWLLLVPNGDVTQAIGGTPYFTPDFPAPFSSEHLTGRQFPDENLITYRDQGDGAGPLLLIDLSHTESARIEIRFKNDRGITIDGDTITMTVASKITLEGDVQITGDVSIEGKLDVAGDIAGGGQVKDMAASMQQDREIYNTHVHPSPAGGSTGPTTQQQGGGA